VPSTNWQYVSKLDSIAIVKLTSAVNPPPAHSLARHSGLPRFLRAAMAAMVMGVIVAGQLLEHGQHGAIYIESFAGVGFGFTASIVKVFTLLIDPGLVKSFFPEWVLMSLLTLPLAGCYICLLLGLGAAIFTGVRRQVPALSAKLACLIFAGLALIIQTGLLVTRTESYRNFDQCAHPEMGFHFCLWPMFFALFAAYHALLFRQARAA
jgi:hypothetical protein